eukprot:764507-Hanusia_phi.AAC.5
MSHTAKEEKRVQRCLGYRQRRRTRYPSYQSLQHTLKVRAGQSRRWRENQEETEAASEEGVQGGEEQGESGEVGLELT